MSNQSNLPANMESSEVVIATERQKAVSVNTIQDLISIPSKRLEVILADHGQDAALEIVVGYISEICSVMAFETTPQMILVASQMILADFPDTKVAALRLFGKEVLYGNIGAKPGKTFRMDAKVLLEMWKEFYTKMAEVFAEHLETRAKEFFPPKKPVDLSKVVPMPDNVKETYQRIERQRIAKAMEIDANRPKPVTKKTLDEIAASEGVDPVVLAEAIKRDAERIFATGGVALEFGAFLAIKVGQVTFEARKDPKYLAQYIKANK